VFAILIGPCFAFASAHSSVLRWLLCIKAFAAFNWNRWRKMEACFVLINLHALLTQIELYAPANERINSATGLALNELGFVAACWLRCWKLINAADDFMGIIGAH